MTEPTTDTTATEEETLPMPEQPTEDRFPGAGGLQIFYRAWFPDTLPRAAIVISHGFNSHGGYYADIARHLAEKELAVYAIDHRGHGNSEGERFFVRDVSEYVDDLGTLIQLVKTRHPGIPVFVLGHSAGGVVACAYALEHQDELAGLISESFAFRLHAPHIVLTVMKALGHLAPHLRVLALPNQAFSRDPEVVEVMDHDPLIAHEKQPASTMAALARADDRLEHDLAKLSLPVLILHGTGDKLTRPSGSLFFYEAARSPDKTLKLYEGYAHDLLHDIDRDRVIADVDDWLLARLPAA